MDEAEASEAHEEQTEASEGDANTGSSGEAQDQPETVDEADGVKAKGRAAATRGPPALRAQTRRRRASASPRDKRGGRRARSRA